ncbi:MAG: L,D-transpeptidase family protein [Chlorobiales bacterium]
MHRRNLANKIIACGVGILIELAIAQYLFAQESKNNEDVWANIEESVEKLKTKFNLQLNEPAIIIDPSKQKLYLIKNKEILKSYSVSTAKAGIGSESGSGKTPIGTHRIKEKFGNGAKLGTIFKARSNSGRLAKIYKDKTDILADEVTTRIMWLDGQENKVNKNGNVDSHKRYIYIHGTPEEGLIGEPASHGCIRMKNADVIELFDAVPSGTLVEIQNKAFLKQK